MARIEDDFKKYLLTDRHYENTYHNHYGQGNIVGAGSLKGNGIGYNNTYYKTDYSGTDIIAYNDKQVFVVQGYVLYVEHIKEPWVKAKIIKNDLTTQDCYIGKINNHIAISNSIRGVLDKLQKQIRTSTNIEKDIAKAFVYAHPGYDNLYNWGEMVFWHSLDKTSCSNGRQRFSEFANKNFESMATPRELIKHMKNSTAWKIGYEMEKLYINKEKNFSNLK